MNPKLPRVVPAEFDERWSDQIQGVPVPDIRLFDPPPADEARPALASRHCWTRRVRSRNH